MNVKDHIEAGHYPRDDKGRALVPMQCGAIATILATDLNIGHFRIIGHRDGAIHQWMADGHSYSDGHPRPFDLLPPPPRKVPIVRWHAIDSDGNTKEWWGQKPIDFVVPKGCRVVELTGEYEEPWS